jgi:predicted enzyme related to lactoylglutathione lyase
MADYVGKFIWCELMTTDAAGAEAFYTHVVGWKAQDSGLPGIDYSYTVIGIGGADIGGILALPKEASEAGARPGWMGYVAVADADASAASIQAAGGAVHRPPADIPSVGRFAVVADPQGAVFNIMKPNPPAGSPDIQLPAPGAPGHVGWHELHATDREAAFAFYAGQFGWTKDEAFDMGGPAGVYQLFATGDAAVGGIVNKMPAFPAPFWLYYFNVEDIDAAIGRLTEGGGKVMNGPHQVPGGSWIVHGLDPQGAMFALAGPRKQ